MTGPVFEARGVVKRWPKAARPVLDGADLDVPTGSVVAITGANGAGKTTLLRIAAGLLIADAGGVRIRGLDPEGDRTAYQQQLGFVGAGSTGLYARLTVEHHLALCARLALMARARRSQAIARVSDSFALAELGGRRVDRLSMGQRQRLRLALAFMHEPDLILLDEPLTSLDDDGIALLGRALATLHHRGGAAVICTPTSLDDRLDMAASYVLAEGRLEAA